MEEGAKWVATSFCEAKFRVTNEHAGCAMVPSSRSRPCSRSAQGRIRALRATRAAYVARWGGTTELQAAPSIAHEARVVLETLETKWEFEDREFERTLYLRQVQREHRVAGRQPRQHPDLPRGALERRQLAGKHDQVPIAARRGLSDHVAAVRRRHAGRERQRHGVALRSRGEDADALGAVEQPHGLGGGGARLLGGDLVGLRGMQEEGRRN